MKARRPQRAAAGQLRRAEPEHACAQFNIPAGSRARERRRRTTTSQPYIQPLGRVLANLYPSPNLVDPTNRYNYVFNTLAADQPDGPEDAVRLQHHQQHEGVRACRDRGRGSRERPWHLVGLLGPGAADADLRHNKGRSVVGQRRQRAQPDDDQRSVGELEPADAGQLLAGSGEGQPEPYPELAGYNQGFFPNDSPYLPLNIITSGWGQGGPGNLWAPAMDVFAHNDALQFSDKLTKIAGSHGLKFGVTAERGQKQQNFQNNEIGLATSSTRGRPAAPATRWATC